MEHRRLNIIVTAILTCLLAGLACKKTIQVNLNNAVPHIVIEGAVTNLPGPYRVRITKTTNFSNPNTFPPVTGAKVIITDSSTGLTETLIESAPGIYSTNVLQGIPRHTYHLSVTAEGQQYTASSMMPPLVPLDSVTYARNYGFDNKLQIDAVINFQDPPGLGNYYQFIEIVNGRLVPNTFVFEDRLSDGRYIRQTLYNDSTYLRSGDTLLLKMYCIDKAIYNYFFSLIPATGNNNSEAVTPANPTTNISNGALGYFSAHTEKDVKQAIY